MNQFLNTPLVLGQVKLPNRLIQGPLAGYSCASFRRLFTFYQAPAYCVSEMLSAQDVITKHTAIGRYLYRALEERLLAYQVSGTDPDVMAQAAAKLEQLGANLIDINCGCPKNKIRKKGAGSALLENPQRLVQIINAVRQAVSCPLTVKIRLLNKEAEHDIDLALTIEQAGADAIVIHPRRAIDSYSEPLNLARFSLIKQSLSIPLILNGDMDSIQSVRHYEQLNVADAYMISRGGTGKPWLYKELLTGSKEQITVKHQIDWFLEHLNHLMKLESEYKAVLQSRSLIRYYFRSYRNENWLTSFYRLTQITQISDFLYQTLPCDRLLE